MSTGTFETTMQILSLFMWLINILEKMIGQPTCPWGSEGICEVEPTELRCGGLSPPRRNKHHAQTLGITEGLLNQNGNSVTREVDTEVFQLAGRGAGLSGGMPALGHPSLEDRLCPMPALEGRTTGAGSKPSPTAAQIN